MSRHGEPPSGAEVYAGLRQQVLDLRPEQLGEGAPADAPILALLLETGYPQAVATLVAVVDGTSSLYFSTGGGIIGAGADEAVAAASQRWLATATGLLDDLAPATDPPPPTTGQAQLVAVTPDGLRAAVAAEAELAERKHILSALYYAGQDVITQIRLVQGA